MTTVTVRIEDAQLDWYRVTLVFDTGAPQIETVVDSYGKVLNIAAAYDVLDENVNLQT